jgi:hypothetical protein
MAVPSTYQRVGNVAVTPSDYDASAGFYYLKFDGVDDGMVTNSIDFTATDKMTVFAGVRKLSDATAGVITELSADRNTNNGSFTLSAVTSPGSYLFVSKGTYDANAYAVGGSSPRTNILTSIGDISGDIAALRINAVQAAISTADQGTGNYGNYQLYIGRRGGTTLPFNGLLYSLIVRGAQTSTTQIAQTERWVNKKTGAY